MDKKVRLSSGISPGRTGLRTRTYRGQESGSVLLVGVCAELGDVPSWEAGIQAGVCVELGTVYRAVVCLPSWGQFTEP